MSCSGISQVFLRHRDFHRLKKDFTLRRLERRGCLSAVDVLVFCDAEYVSAGTRRASLRMRGGNGGVAYGGLGRGGATLRGSRQG